MIPKNFWTLPDVLGSLPDIWSILPDLSVMSGIFRIHWTDYQYSDRQNHFLVCRTKCAADIQCSVWHFDFLPDILLPDVKQIGSFICRKFICRTFPPHWPLPDKMSSSAWTLCWTFQNCAEHVQHIWWSLIQYQCSSPIEIWHVINQYMYTVEQENFATWKFREFGP